MKLNPRSQNITVEDLVENAVRSLVASEDAMLSTANATLYVEQSKAYLKAAGLMSKLAIDYVDLEPRPVYR